MVLGFGLTDGKKRGGKKNLLIICYCPLMSLQVFIQDITDTQILTVTHVHVCVPFCALLYNPGCKWSLLEQRMRPLPSISLITSKLLPLFFPLSPSHRLYFLFFFVPSRKEWKEWCVIISPLKASLLMPRLRISRVAVGRSDTLNGLWTYLLA